MNITRAYLGEVEVLQGAEQMEPVIPDDFTDIEEYSRFKFGDGEAGTKYGSLLGELVLADSQILESDGVYVASSAYRVAPPASESLLEPFIGSATNAAKSIDSDTPASRHNFFETTIRIAENS